MSTDQNINKVLRFYLFIIGAISENCIILTIVRQTTNIGITTLFTLMLYYCYHQLQLFTMCLDNFIVIVFRGCTFLLLN
jgi:hypothetical protein